MDLYVFKSDYTPLGMLSSPTAFSFIERVRAKGEFTVYLPMNDKNAELAKEENIVQFNDKNGIAGVIRKISKAPNEEGVMVLTISGGLCDDYMYRRICWGMYSKSGVASDIIEDMISTQVTNPQDPNRAIPDFIVGSSKTQKGADITYQSTGGNVGDNVDSICSTNNLCRSVKFDPIGKRIVFSIFEGVDRTEKQKAVPPCVFSQKFENILSSNYMKDTMNSFNVGLIGGEELEGQERVFVEVGSQTGKLRKEIFIDAKSVRSKQNDGTILDATQYKALLVQKGEEKMERVKDVESFDCVVNTLGNIRYGVDYFLGDKVTIRDEQLGVSIDAEITEVERCWDSNGETILITFGFGQLTLAEKLKAKEVQ